MRVADLIGADDAFVRSRTRVRNGRGLLDLRLLDGGDLGIDWRADGVWMTGPAVTVFEGRLTADFLAGVQ